MRLIDADALRDAMYHEAFETDSDMQKWESGCWIRYKMFEKHIEAAPTIDAVPVVRCKDCKNNMLQSDSGIVICEIDIGLHPLNGFCSRGERGEE